jgi:hypothetical protein
MVWQSDQTFDDLESEQQMSYTELHPYLRGSHLEGRTPLCVRVEDQATAEAQIDLLADYVCGAQITWTTEADYGTSCRDGQWYVHYWRGEWDVWDAPDMTARKVGPADGANGMIRIG